MSSTFYLPRSLSRDDKTYTEMELLSTSRYVVVLAEPGGGKTELMGSLAQRLGTVLVTANKFVHMGAESKNVPLVIDAFDELAKVDNSGIYRLLSQAKSASPTHVYLSSRSSEWGNAATNSFKEFFGHSPLVLRLCDFDEAEQRAIFDHHVQGEDFVAFQTEVARFDLEMLLPNPQFLKLFADAYIESERHFTDKRSIFAQAVERLAKEANDNVMKSNTTLSTTQKLICHRKFSLNYCCLALRVLVQAKLQKIGCTRYWPHCLTATQRLTVSWQLGSSSQTTVRISIARFTKSSLNIVQQTTSPNG